MGKTYVFSQDDVEYARVPVQFSHESDTKNIVNRSLNAANFNRIDHDDFVKNGNGTPLLRYHGTIWCFNDEEIFPFSHFGTRLSALQSIEKSIDQFASALYRGKAENDGSLRLLFGQFRPRIVLSYLKIKNPLRIKDPGGPHPLALANQLRDEGIVDQSFRNMIAGQNNPLGRELSLNMLKEKLDKAGYDGIVYKNEVEDKGYDSYIILESEQMFAIEEQNISFDEVSNAGYMDKLSGMCERSGLNPKVHVE